MHLLIISSTFPSCPEDHIAAPFILPLLDDLAAAGHRVTVLTHRKDGGAAWSPPGARVVRFDAGRVPGRVGEARLLRFGDVAFLLRVLGGGLRAALAVAREDRPDAALALWFAPAGIWAAALRRAHGVPYAVWALGSDVRRIGALPGGAFLLRRIAAHAGRIYADSPGLVRRLGECGVAAAFLSSARRLPAPRPGGAPPCDVAFVGRLAEVKGADVFSAAVERISARRSVSAAMAGDGPLRERIAASPAARGGALRLLGPLDPSGVSSLLASCRCLAVPSRAESIPLVLGEAVAAGRTVVVSDVGDMGDLVRTHRLGRVVPPGDASALADAIESVLDGGDVSDPGGRAALLRLLDPAVARARLVRDLSLLASSSVP